MIVARPRPLLALCVTVLGWGCSPREEAPTPTSESAIPHDTTPEAFAPASVYLEASVKEGAFPGCAVAVGTHRGPLWLRGFGRLHDENSPTVSSETLYDLASLTKVCGTTLVVLRLVVNEALALNDPVAKYLPGFRGGRRERVTVEHLLTHSSGLPAWRPLYEKAAGHEAIVHLVEDSRLEAAPGTRFSYSDLGFILLGEVAARAGGKPLAILEEELVWRPLALTDTLRRPTENLRARIAPTEVVEAGAAPLRGVVHDENARAAGGLTGHAGLFSCARDLARLATELLRGWRGESEIFPQRVLREFATRRDLPPGSSRALGWDTPSGESSSGRYFSALSFGHTGFTGTSLWIDPARDLYLILLSNRVCPDRENQKILRVRRELANRVVHGLEPDAVPRS